ncbi:MAG: hypothetical protein HQL49_06620 [Gammaproteobacteria bacterium]|nr:hypothetical protein [Gammaproteobacteria bacterium]
MEELNIERVREKYGYLLESDAARTISTWIDPNADEPFDPKEYVEQVNREGAALQKLIDAAIRDI